MWLFYALIAALGYSGTILSIKHILRTYKDSWMLSFYFSLFGALFTFPFFLFELDFPTKEFWLLLIITKVLVVAYNYTQFKAYHFLSATSIAVLSKIRFVFLFIAGVVLNEILDIKSIFGIMLILGASLLAINYKKWQASKQGVTLVIIASFLFTAFALLTKPLAVNIKPFSFIFLGFIVACIINAIAMPNFKKRAQKKPNTKDLLVLGFFAAIANVALAKALTFDQNTIVFFIFEASLIPVIIGEYALLKDKEHILKKVIAIALVLIGIYLLS